MQSLAIILVVISALTHSFWNLLAKKSTNKLVFNWYITLFGAILYSPFFLYFIFVKEIQNIGWLFIILSAIFHVFYLYFLGKSYQKEHLSLTYPITRSSTIFIPFLAVILIKEKLSLIGIVGIIITLIGIYILHLRSFRFRSFLAPLRYIKEKATLFALLTALVSAFYSVNDKIGVMFVSPFLYIYLISILTSIFYLPIVLHKKNCGDIKNEWRYNKKSIISAGFLIIISYVLILFAFRIDKVSYIASLRQLSIIFGVLLGIFILKEEYGKIRLIASIIMFIGFILVAMA